MRIGNYVPIDISLLYASKYLISKIYILYCDMECLLHSYNGCHVKPRPLVTCVFAALVTKPQTCPTAWPLPNTRNLYTTPCSLVACLFTPVLNGCTMVVNTEHCLLLLQIRWWEPLWSCCGHQETQFIQQNMVDLYIEDLSTASSCPTGR